MKSPDASSPTAQATASSVFPERNTEPDARLLPSSAKRMPRSWRTPKPWGIRFSSSSAVRTARTVHSLRRNGRITTLTKPFRAKTASAKISGAATSGGWSSAASATPSPMPMKSATNCSKSPTDAGNTSKTIPTGTPPNGNSTGSANSPANAKTSVTSATTSSLSRKSKPADTSPTRSVTAAGAWTTTTPKRSTTRVRRPSTTPPPRPTASRTAVSIRATSGTCSLPDATFPAHTWQ